MKSKYCPHCKTKLFVIIECHDNTYICPYCYETIGGINEK